MAVYIAPRPTLERSKPGGGSKMFCDNGPTNLSQMVQRGPQSEVPQDAE